MSQEHPRVLHVGFNPIGSATNTGLTLGSMFADWPRDRLFELYTPSRQPLMGIENVLVAPPSSAPLDGLARRVLGSRLPAPVTDGLNSAVSRKGVSTPLSVRLRIAASLLNDIGPVWTGGRWVDDLLRWEPRVIHSLLGGVRITRFVVSLSKRLDLPVVPHFMDDWMGTLYADGQLLGLARREVDRLIEAVLARSPLCIAIGRDMQAEYSRRLGLECRVVGNSVDFEAFDVLSPAGRAGGGPRSISYVGGLHLGRDKVLREVGKAIARATGTDSGAWVVRLMVPAADLDAARALAAEVPTIEVGGTVAPQEVPATLVGSDALLFVESSDPSIARFTRLSVSTKVPEYLAARRPVLVVGPEDQASVRSLMRSGVAHFAGDGQDQRSLDGAWSQLTEAWQERSVEAPLSSEILDEFGRQPTQRRLQMALVDAVRRS